MLRARLPCCGAAQALRREMFSSAERYLCASPRGLSGMRNASSASTESSTSEASSSKEGGRVSGAATSSSTRNRSSSIDLREVEKFNLLAANWWDPDGPASPLHRMNPARLSHIRTILSSLSRDTRNLRRYHRPLQGLSIVDVGCGGGLVTEPLARLGANALGVDLSTDAIRVARQHMRADNYLASCGHLRYENASVEQLVEKGSTFDAVLALEIVEHVKEPRRFLADCARLVAESGVLVISSINRTVASYVMAIVGAERIARWLPVGTHDWNRFPTPEEVALVIKEDTRLVPESVVGIGYNPITGFSVAQDTSVNYILASRHPGTAKSRDEGESCSQNAKNVSEIPKENHEKKAEQ